MRLARYLALMIGMCVFWTGAAEAQEVSAPRSFEAIASSPTEIGLYWLPAEGATGYRVQREGKPLAELPATAQGYRDTGLTPNATYRYTVQALRDGQESKAREYIERTFATFPNRDAAYDVVIVQASSGGVTAAIAAGKRGLKVALIEPTTRLGGMPVNGLSASDIRRPQLYMSGFLARLRDTVKALYENEGVKATGLQYEPRIAHQAMKSLLYAAPNVDVYRRTRMVKVISKPNPPAPFPTSPRSSAGKGENSRLYHTNDSPFPVSAANAVGKGAGGLGKERRRVEAIVVEELNAAGEPTGKKATFRAKVFIDSTDSGDLAAWAGAPYRLGREPRTPDEPHNGVIYYDRANDAYLPGSTGKGDKRMQSYAYLFVVKDYGPNVDKTIPKPPHYDRENYIHTPAWEKSWAFTSGKLPAGKYELNQHPQGGDLQEINNHYPEADYRERRKVEQRYRDHVLGYLYYIQTEQGQKQLGFPDDEYRDNGGFPPLLYVREGRRIIGEQLPVEREIMEARKIVRPESIGLGDYPMDSHAVRVKTDWNSPDMGEGEWWLYKQTPWYGIPFGVIVPKTLDNVFMTTAVSSTHVSFGTFRMEPVRMQFGQTAGIAAFLAIRYNLTGREVPARQVQDELLPWLRNPNGDEAIVLHHFPDVNRQTVHYNAIQYLAARGFLPEGEKFEPDKPTTRAEAAKWLRMLAERGAPDPVQTLGGTRQAYFPYAGGAPNRAGVPNWTDSVPVTRGEFARALASVLKVSGGQAGASRLYADVPDASQSALLEAMRLYGVDPLLWEGVEALTSDGKRTFKPDAPLSHADMFATLYIAQLSLGPLFNDAPVDGKNGRAVPSYPTVPR